jgi:hypothetical protein
MDSFVVKILVIVAAFFVILLDQILWVFICYIGDFIIFAYFKSSGLLNY